MWLLWARRRGNRSRGQSIVEFALVLPIMLFLFVGIVDLGRVYTAMIGVESAAREAADYGTTLGSGRWEAGAIDATVRDMRIRACTAANSLPDYDGTGDECANPSFSWCVSGDRGQPCVTTPTEVALINPACDVATREPPCWVTVTMEYDFNLIVPLNFEAFGVRYGLPSSLTFTRSSTFAMTDFE
jgi:hypothetical protein